MSLVHRSGTEHSISPTPTTAIALRVSAISLLALLAFCLFARPAHASGSLSLGTIQMAK
jgi:hypothetical protein